MAIARLEAAASSSDYAELRACMLGLNKCLDESTTPTYRFRSFFPFDPADGPWLMRAGALLNDHVKEVGDRVMFAEVTTGEVFWIIYETNDPKRPDLFRTWLNQGIATLD